MLKAQVLCTADKSTKLWLFHMVKIANGTQFIHCMETCTRIIYIYRIPHVRSSNTVRLYMGFCVASMRSKFNCKCRTVCNCHSVGNGYDSFKTINQEQ